MAYKNSPPFKSQSLPLYGQRRDLRDRIDYKDFYDRLDYEERQKDEKKMSYLCFPLIPKHARCDESSLSSDTSCSSVEYYGPSHWGAAPRPRPMQHASASPKMASSPDNFTLSINHLPKRRYNASSESLTRKEMREVVKAKVEAERARLDDSSSDEAPSPRPLKIRYHSDEMLSRRSAREKYISSVRLNRMPKMTSSNRLNSGSPSKAVLRSEVTPCQRKNTPPLSWNESQLYKQPKQVTNPYFSPEDAPSSDEDSLRSGPIADLSTSLRQPSPTYRLTWKEQRKTYLSSASPAPCLVPPLTQKNDESKMNGRSASNYSTCESTFSFPSSPQDSGFSTLSVGSNPTSRAPTPPPRSPISRSRLCEEILARNRATSPKPGNPHLCEVPRSLHAMVLTENIASENNHFPPLKSPLPSDPFSRTKNIPTGLPPKGIVSQKKASAISQKVKQLSELTPLCNNGINTEGKCSNSSHKWDTKSLFNRSFSDETSDKYRMRTGFENLNHSEYSPFKTIVPQKTQQCQTSQGSIDSFQRPRDRSLRLAKEIIDSVLQRECKRRYSENLDDAMGELERIYLCLNANDESKPLNISDPKEECRFHPLVRCKSDSWQNSATHPDKPNSFSSKTHPTKSKTNMLQLQAPCKPLQPRDQLKRDKFEQTKLHNYDHVPKGEFDVEELLKDMPKVNLFSNITETSPGITTPSLISPGITTPCLNSPGITTPCLNSPGITTPCLNSPGITTPCLNSPEITTPCLKRDEKMIEDGTSNQLPKDNTMQSKVSDFDEGKCDATVTATSEKQSLDSPTSGTWTVSQVWHLQIHQDQEKITSALSSLNKDLKMRMNLFSDTESAYWTESENRLESLLNTNECKAKVLTSPTSPQSDSGVKGSWPSSNDDEDSSFFHASPKIQLSSKSPPAIFNTEEEMAQPPSATSSKSSNGAERRPKGRGAAAGGQDEVLGELKGGGVRSRLPNKKHTIMPLETPLQPILTRSTRASRLRMQANSSESSKQKDGKFTSSSPHPTDVNKNVTKSTESSHAIAQQKTIDKLKDKSGKRKSCLNTLGEVKDKKVDSPSKVKNDRSQDPSSDKDAVDKKSKSIQHKVKPIQGSQQLPSLRRPEIPKVFQQKRESVKVAPKPNDKAFKNNISIIPSNHLPLKDDNFKDASDQSTSLFGDSTHLDQTVETSSLFPSSLATLAQVSSFNTPPSLPSSKEVPSLHPLPSNTSTSNHSIATDQVSASPLYTVSATYHSSIYGDNTKKLSSTSTHLPSNDVKEKTNLWISSTLKSSSTTFHKTSLGTVTSSKILNSGVDSSHLHAKQSSESKGAKNVSSILKSTTTPSKTLGERPFWSSGKGNNLPHKPPHSILKKKESFEEKEGGPSFVSTGLHSILKKHSSEEDERRSSSPEIHPILKNRFTESTSAEESPERKPILKKRSSLAEEPILSHLQRVEPPKPILKKIASTEGKPKPILKSKKSMEEFNWTSYLSSRPRANSSDTGIRSILKKAKDSSSADNPKPSNDSSSISMERHKSRRVSLESGLLSAKLMPAFKSEKNDSRSESFSAIVESCQSTGPCDIFPMFHSKSSDKETINGDQVTTASANFTDDQALRTFSLLHDPPLPNIETSSTDSNGQEPSSSHTTESSIMDGSIENSIKDKISQLSVMEKLRLFEQLETKDKPLNVKVHRRQSSRFQTQPVTLEEVRKAAQMSSPQPVPENDPSRLSLKEKLKLFNEKLVLKPSNAVKPARSRDLRRSTQPVTLLEIQQAIALPQNDEAIFQVSISSKAPMNHKIEQDFDSSNLGVLPNTNGATDMVDGSKTSKASLPKDKGLKEKANTIKNSAVKRRYNAILRRKQENRHTISSVTDLSSNGDMTGERTRALTESVLDGILDCPGESIAERLTQLSKNCDETWKQRLQSLKNEDLEEVKSKGEGLLSRVCQLEEAREQWRERVQEKDAVQFTVAGKMAASSLQTLHSSDPFILPALSQLSSKRERKHPTPRPLRMTSTSSSTCQKSVMVNGESSSKILTSISTSAIEKITISYSSKETTTEPQHHNSTYIATKVDTNRVKLVHPDDEDTFQSFFPSAAESLENETVLATDNVSLDEIVSHAHPLSFNRKAVKFARRTVASHNPLKVLAARTDLLQEYEETTTKSAALMLNNNHSSNEGLALSALAGLASQEDFTNVALKKIQPAVAPLLPQKDMMLLQIKGRRHVQTRLVEPSIDSINSGDNYVLVTPSCVYNYVGPYANVIEVSKGAEVASVIQANKDLCFSGTAEVATISANQFCPDFLRHLGYVGDISKDINTVIRPPTSDDEDRIYEQALIDTSMIYQVEDKKLVPHHEYWGTLPSYGMLDSTQVYIFDFGSEFYVWQGKLSSPALRKTAMQLARELWDLDYDYKECGFNPLHARLEGSLTGRRPSWALFAKINQNMEPVLFREKFTDWPDVTGRLISVKKSSSEVAMEEMKVDGLYQLEACDAKALITSQLPEPDLILEGSHLGRGKEYYDSRENRHFLIETIGVTTWLVREYDCVPLEKSWNGIFYSGETYVIRWQYHIIQTAKNLTGQQSRHSIVGRERCAYYFWQGLDSTISEKGASALMTVELNEERGPHVRVVQGKEPPCFLNLFDGAMIINSGKRDDPEYSEKYSGERWKLLMARGEFPSEAHLVQVSCEASSLRSRAGFLLISLSSHHIMVWRGGAMSSFAKEVLSRVQNSFIKRFASSHSLQLNHSSYSVDEMEEGLETPEFWSALEGGSSKSYHSLFKAQPLLPWRGPRLFQFSSVHGDFKATEITAPSSTRTHICAFPFSQNDLYGAMSQPALFLVDSGAETIYLWQGWWPEGENVQPGSLRMRWAVERRCAMETALSYAQELAAGASTDLGCYLVWAGLEPVHFISLFPDWTTNYAIAELNQKSGRQPGELQEVSAVLQQVTRTEYSLEELLQLPPGVDPLKLESYLSSQEFKKIIGLSKEEFYQLPFWKQIKLKQSVGLF